MDLLEQIRNVKQSAGYLPFENPLPHVESVFRQVHEKRLGAMLKYGMSWAGLVEADRLIDPTLTDTVLALSLEFGTGIHGSYVEGSHTSEMLQCYNEKLDAWIALSLQLFHLVSESR